MKRSTSDSWATRSCRESLSQAGSVIAKLPRMGRRKAGQMWLTHRSVGRAVGSVQCKAQKSAAGNHQLVKDIAAGLGVTPHISGAVLFPPALPATLPPSCAQ